MSTPGSTVGVPRRHAFQNSVIGGTQVSTTTNGTSALRKGSLGSNFPNIRKIRPVTPESLASDDSDKMTKDQHICIQNMGMAAAFFLPIALIGAGVAIGTNYWFNVEGNYVGMFVYCNNWTQECGGISELYTNNTFRIMSKRVYIVTTGPKDEGGGINEFYTNNSFIKNIWTIGVPLEVGGAATLFIGLLTLVCYPCHRRVNFSKVCCGVTVGVILLIGVLAFIGGTALFLYFSMKESPKPDLMWSFFISAGSAVFAFIAVVLLWIHVFYTGCFDMD